MTTIAYDGRYVAADSQVCFGACRGAKSVQKIKVRGSVAYACTGHGALFDPMIVWFEMGAKPEDKPKVSDDKNACLLVFSDGKCRAYKSDLPYPEELFGPDAWGSGAEYAIGAMRAGASAEHAVRIAIECDVYSGGPTQVIDLYDLQARAA